MRSRSPNRSLNYNQMINRTAAIIALSSAAWGVSAQTASATTAAPAHKQTTEMHGAFARADANGDKKLSKDEAERLPAIAAKFESLDKNQDGSLSQAEFAVGFHSAQ